FERHLEEDPRLAIAACWYWIRKLQARLFAGDYASAAEAASKAQRLLWTSPSHVEVAEYHFYGALARAAHYRDAAPEERTQYLAALAAHRRQMEEWAQHCPENFANRASLVAAEIAAIEGRGMEAMHLYEQAIRSARENGFVQNEGIAYECAAAFYRTNGFESFADSYLKQARDCYARWGADGKVRQLETCYLQLQAKPEQTLATPLAQLDFLSVAKASQAISGRIVLDELVDTLMRIVIENAGAQTGYLILVRDARLALVAEAHVAQQDVHVQLHRDSGIPASVLPESILNYVRRSKETVLLENATAPHLFSDDPYFFRCRPKSMLCLPILRQAGLLGLLYLENNLVTHTFTPGRVSLLELLASQAAISLENAQLYADVRQENIERKRAEEALQERESRIRRLVESNIIGIFYWDLSGNITEANNAFLQMIGYSRQDLSMGKVHWAHMTPPEYRALDERKAAEVQETRTCTPYEKEYFRKDGSRIPVLIGAVLLDGAQDHGIAFVLDLTERKQAEAEREGRRAAEAANRAKSAFLANMSHELRTPLNGILGYAQILQRDQTLGERQLAGVNVIRQSGEHLLTIINDILDLAKIEAGKMELYLVDIRLIRFVQTIVEMIGVKATQKGLEIFCDMAPDVPQYIRVDEKRLRQVLLNLLSNAVKFTDHGRVTLRVCFTPPSRLCFEVQDTGVGISEDQLDAIFQPFEQVCDAQRRLGGTGLGLSISRQYVHLMGSEIRVKSRLGQGSTFWFELEVPVIETATTTALAKIVTGYTGPRKMVLVADDMAENRAVAADMLKPLGFEIFEATNGREALQIAQSLRPHLILMDIVMPGMDGLEAVRRLRRMRVFNKVPIIAISASGSGDDHGKRIAAGFNAVLLKPIDLDELLRKIAKLLQLDWTYALPGAKTSVQAEAFGPLVAPPQQEMEVLYRLARRGNMQDILERAAYLTELDQRYGPFANQLRLLAKGYQSKAILSLVERYLSGNQVQ
ncbi:MAG TPA: ATP-binding protein, partial [Noviherbaspirillum sp.]